MKTTIKRSAIATLLLLVFSLAGLAQKRTTQATLYRQFVPSTITLKDGRKLKQPLTNVFLKNSSLVYLKGEYTMEANMDNIAVVEFKDRKFININNQLAYLVDSVGQNAVYRIDLFDMVSYKAQLRNNINISNIEIGEMVSTTSVDLNNEEDYKFPVFPEFYFLYNGQYVKAHEREISRRLPKDGDLKRKYKTAIGMKNFSWTDETSLVVLLKAITPDSIKEP